MIEAFYIFGFISALSASFVLGGVAALTYIRIRHGKDAAARFFKEEF